MQINVLLFKLKHLYVQTEFIAQKNISTSNTGKVIQINFSLTSNQNTREFRNKITAQQSHRCQVMKYTEIGQGNSKALKCKHKGKIWD